MQVINYLSLRGNSTSNQTCMQELQKFESPNSIRSSSLYSLIMYYYGLPLNVLLIKLSAFIKVLFHHSLPNESQLLFALHATEHLQQLHLKSLMRHTCAQLQVAVVGTSLVLLWKSRLYVTIPMLVSLNKWGRSVLSSLVLSLGLICCFGCMVTLFNALTWPDTLATIFFYKPWCMPNKYMLQPTSSRYKMFSVH